MKRPPESCVLTTTLINNSPCAPLTNALPTHPPPAPMHPPTHPTPSPFRIFQADTERVFRQPSVFRQTQKGSSDNLQSIHNTDNTQTVQQERHEKPSTKLTGILAHHAEHLKDWKKVWKKHRTKDRRWQRDIKALNNLLVFLIVSYCLPELLSPPKDVEIASEMSDWCVRHGQLVQ